MLHALLTFSLQKGVNLQLKSNILLSASLHFSSHNLNVSSVFCYYLKTLFSLTHLQNLIYITQTI